jgi:hypothetical protein
VIEVDGVRVPRALDAELAHQLVHRDELKTASNLLAGLAGGEPAIMLSETTATSSEPRWKRPPPAWRRLGTP